MASKTRVIVHHEPNPEHFALTRSDLAQVTALSRVPEKENTLFLIGLLVPTLVNIFSSWPKENEILGPLFVINLLIAIVSTILAIFQGRGWHAKRGAFDCLIQSFAERPKIQMEYLPADAYVVVEPRSNPDLANAGRVS